MRIVSLRRALTSVGLAALALPPAHAQGAAIVPEAVQVAAMLRSQGSVDFRFTFKLLTQLERPLSRASLDAIADSLAAFAISTVKDRTSDRTSREEALSVLARAGSASNRTPYDGAAARLLRVAENAVDLMDRVDATNLLSRVANKAAMISAFRTIATSSNLVAFIAVRELGEAHGGLEVLREFDRTNAVTEPRAVKELAFIARKQGWRSRSQ